MAAFGRTCHFLVVLVAILGQQLHVGCSSVFPEVFLRNGKHGIVLCYGRREEGQEPDETPVTWFKLNDSRLEPVPISPEENPSTGYWVDIQGSLVIQNVTLSDEGKYVCSQEGEASDTSIDVEVIDDSQLFPVVLERGKKGTVPFYPLLYNQFLSRNSDTVYWCSGPACREEDIVASTYNGTADFWVDSDFSLVIANVTEAHGDGFWFKLRPPRNGVLSEWISVNVTDPPGVVWLERGAQGTVPFGAQRRNLSGDDDFLYWYFGDDTKLRASLKLKQELRPTPNPDGAFYVDANWSLVIRTVTDSDEGIYLHEVRSRRVRIQDVQIPVRVKVSPDVLRPVVDGCESLSKETPAECQVVVAPDVSTHNLTCILRHAKPPVHLQWHISGDPVERKHRVFASQMQTILPPDSTDPDFQINTTYTSILTFEVQLNESEGRQYACVARGVALGNQSGINITVTISPAGTSTSPKTGENTQEPPNDQEQAYARKAGIAFGVALGCIVVLVIVGFCIWRILSKTKQDWIKAKGSGAYHRVKAIFSPNDEGTEEEGS